MLQKAKDADKVNYENELQLRSVSFTLVCLVIVMSDLLGSTRENEQYSSFGAVG